MRRGADSPYLAATDLAEYLVRQGTPFRGAHAIVGDLVRRSLEGEGSLAELVAADPQLGDEAAALLAPGAAVANRVTPGGGGPVSLDAQLVAVRKMMASQSQWLVG